MFKAVIFDLDGTLAEFLSWNEITVGLGVSLEEHRNIYQELGVGNIDVDEAQKKLLELWKSGGSANKETFLEIFHGIPLRTGAEETVKYLKRKGYRTCIITGATDLYAELVAEKLGIDRWFANTKLKFSKAGNLTDLEYHLDQAKRKLEQFNEFIKSEGIEAKECAIVGDSWNDNELFKTTGHGIAVKSLYEDPELEKIAWKVIRELPELRKIL